MVKSPPNKDLPPKYEWEPELEEKRGKHHREQDDSDDEEDLAHSFAKMALGTRPLRLEAGAQPNVKTSTSAPILSPLQLTLREARRAGEDITGLSMYPVVERPDPTNPGQILRVHEPIPFKTLKEFKTSVSMYGPTSPFVLGLLDTVTSEALLPLDWQTLAKACLSPGDYLMWKSNWIELSAEQAARNQQHGVPITLEMLIGTVAYHSLQAQMTFPLQAYQQINVCGTKAWRGLPTKGEKTMDITKIIQGPEEPYQDFVARLLQAVDRMVGDPDAGSLLVKQLGFENVNRTCQEALRPYRKRGSISEFSHICPSICPRCCKGKHWASGCHSQTDIDGRPIDLHKGNSKWGRSWPRQTVGALSLTPAQPYHTGLPIGPLSKNSTMPPQEVQDWTSVTPPNMY
ncbi:hypothetical protein QTO34_016856 [Cnephaeus nilssonii]|uniref:Retroviral nucleocapsid Gag protein p24 C-terminal domain-containing protein n=1 Tax=Cnephaeus nilssonii TaxID=3371016 RepID=A0AA40I3Y7_CNENI|nr:hypothetical protein QTO34_016856 [Eptesicus nilssonii]